MAAFAASAPGKVILLGEHGVNRCQPALAAAIDRRVHCRVARRTDAVYAFQGDGRSEEVGAADLLAHKERIDALRAGGALDELRRATAGDFFAPARYVLAHVVAEHDLPGLDIAWRSELPVGAGVGSGAAASAAMAFAALLAADRRPDPERVAFLAWQGDVIAHGGVASGLDSGASALGGITRYTLADGPSPTPSAAPLTLVVADTSIQANTADVNTRVRRWLDAHPERMHLFGDMGLLVEGAAAALAEGDLERLGKLFNLGQLVLEKLGVSCPEIERLVEAALGAGALGAKLSGSGGGGIVIALPPPGGAERVVAAMAAVAGGETMVVAAGAVGVREEASDDELGR
jgi:mevalonate kinase